MTEKTVILTALLRVGAKVLHMEIQKGGFEYYDLQLADTYETITLKFDEIGKLVLAE